ncbi:S-formylglutathione hydrolase [Psychrobacter sp. I-STPA10]|uniref:S-formylglutathione hydrolase n=1 Tax=Psychrobacter sp. I-STPA10 TaxID=2585769 RepID=UPI001E59841D|nr:S-formylglutathione hydrolase [Psychrobacter sp. I-STPA10]
MNNSSLQNGLTLQSNNRCFYGEQRYYQHQSAVTKSVMTFSVYLPDAAIVGHDCPAILYLSGLTCNTDNVTHKAHFQQLCSELGVIFIAPDTSPRGENVADDEQFFIGQAASYYVDATCEPWAEHYQMQSYIVEELYDLIHAQFPISSLGLMGHSMGGHGALMLGFKFADKFASVSAIAPACVASQSQKGQAAYQAYFGEDKAVWQQHDAIYAIWQAGQQYVSILVDQGQEDEFYQAGQLQTQKLQQVCCEVKQPLTIRYHAGYDHGYYFIQTVMADHITHHLHAANLLVDDR